jgi:general stress protein 26
MKQAEVKTKALAVLLQKGATFILSTVDSRSRPQSRYMGGLVQVAGKPFDFYLITGVESRKVKQLAGNANAQILAARPDWSEIVTLNGKAAVVKSAAAKRAAWDGMPGAHQYFTGLDDPRYGVLLFKGRQLEYLGMGGAAEPTVVKL